MKIYIVIPAHNEEKYLPSMLNSIVEQTMLPTKVVVVNDNSSDNSQTIIDSFTSKFHFISSVKLDSEKKHEPGSKVVKTFYKGLETLDDSYDIICKFDADLIFPKHYLEKLHYIFKENPKCGMAGGFCYIEENGDWSLENLTNKDHIRGALKSYTKECFQTIGGLKKSMGWDTVDELLAKFHGWKVITDSSLHVKHLKPTGKAYTKTSKYKQGEAFYRMRYGFVLTQIASAKLALKKNDFSFYFDCIRGFHKAKRKNLSFIVSEEEGEFIRKLRWEGIRNKIL